MASQRKTVDLLGLTYALPRDDKELFYDIQSRMWMSYRAGFVPIKSSNGGYSTDTGWGCMLRVGQMLLAHVLMVKFLGRGWRWSADSSRTDAAYRELSCLFFDDPGCPFSIHCLTRLGECMSKRVGEWFGPGTVSHVLRRALLEHPIGGVEVTLFNDGLVRSEELLWESTDTGNTRLVILCLRLGLESVNQIYYRAVNLLMRCPLFSGMLGGRPNAAFYFIGSAQGGVASQAGEEYQGHSLLYLDPHTTQPHVEKQQAGDMKADASFHTFDVRQLAMSELDPSVAVSFVCQSQQEMDVLRRHLGATATSLKTSSPFTIDHSAAPTDQDTVTRRPPVKHEPSSLEGDDSDYELL